MIMDFIIDGELKHLTEKTYPVTAPADGRVLAVIPDAGAEDVNAAVQAAKDAYYREWKFYDPQKKEKLFWKWAELLESHAEEIAEWTAAENGSNAKGAVGGVKAAAQTIRYYAGLITKNYGDVLMLEDSHLNYVVKEPLGVVAQMVPWNSPIGIAVNKLAPALAAGNTVVMRAPDEAPLGILKIGQTLLEAGFPKGVANFIAGCGPESGKVLVNHPDVRLISFTGSNETGRQIMKSAAENMKRVVLELGGKTPMIVYADADLKQAAETAVRCAFAYQGQICTALSRVLVEKSIYAEFMGKVREQVSRFQPAYPDEEASGPAYGPLFNAKQYKRVEQYVELARRDGKITTGGNRISTGKFANGYYFEPTIVEFDDDASRVAKDEIFGPVLSVIPFETEEDAIRIANNSRFALSASVWTKDAGKSNRTVRRLEAGTVWVNGFFQFSLHSPWGGFKESGIGREYGKYAMESYMDYKNVWVNP